MPLYEFECSDCGEQFEALVRDAVPPVCPECQSPKLERLISMFGVSSEGTRELNLKGARRQNARTQRDKNIADAESARDHHD